MNVIRTIKKSASPQWVNLLFDPESSPAPEGFAPLEYPFPVTFRQKLVGGYLYIRYRGQIIGYGKIAEVIPHSGDTVGAENIVVDAGDKVILEAPLSRILPALPSLELFRWKYVEANLHEVLQENE